MPLGTPDNGEVSTAKRQVVRWEWGDCTPDHASLPGGLGPAGLSGHKETHPPNLTQLQPTHSPHTAYQTANIRFCQYPMSQLRHL